MHPVEPAFFAQTLDDPYRGRRPRSRPLSERRGAYLQQTADDAALPRVQVVLPKEGPPTEALTLPGDVKAWNEAAIYGQVSGYLSQRFKDYGAHVNAGDLLATIDTPSMDAQLASSKASLAAAQTHYNLAAEAAKRYDTLTTAPWFRRRLPEDAGGDRRRKRRIFPRSRRPDVRSPACLNDSDEGIAVLEAIARRELAGWV